MAADKIDVTKSEFILSQPPDLHAADVVVNARDAGLAIDLPLVYMVRTRASARRQASSPSAQASSVTSKRSAIARSARAARATKADFVRARTNLAPKEIAPKEIATKEITSREIASKEIAKEIAPKEIASKEIASKEIAEQPKSGRSKLEVGSVRNARKSNKTKRKPAAKKRSPLVFAKPEPVLSRPTSDNEELLKIIAAELGLGRAIDVLRAERSRVRALFPVNI